MLQVEENYEKLKSENTILLTELQQFIKLNDENEKRNKKLEQELQTIKQERDKLINQNAADTESFIRFNSLINFQFFFQLKRANISFFLIT